MHRRKMNKKYLRVLLNSFLIIFILAFSILNFNRKSEKLKQTTLRIGAAAGTAERLLESLINDKNLSFVEPYYIKNC